MAHASCGPAGVWGGWVGPWPPGAPGHRWGLSGSQQRGGWAPCPLQSWGHQALRPSLTARPPPPPKHMEEAPALCSGRMVTTEPGAPPWAVGGSSGPGQEAAAVSASATPELWDPRPGDAPTACCPSKGGRVDMGGGPEEGPQRSASGRLGLPQRSTCSADPGGQVHGVWVWRRLLKVPCPGGGGCPTTRGTPPVLRELLAVATGATSEGWASWPRLGSPGIAGLTSPGRPGEGGRWPQGLWSTYQSARHHRVRRKPFRDHLH